MQRHNIPGTVAISFGPAEEQLVEPAAIWCAPAISRTSTRSSICTSGDSLATGYGLQNYAAISSIFTFHGKTAHGAVNPWDGKDAVDAVELMDIGFDKLREHLRPTYRAHRTITVGGIQPNIIADTGQIWWFVRDASMPAAKETYDKLAEDRRRRGADDRHDLRRQIRGLGLAAARATRRSPRAIQKNIDAVGMPKWTEEEQQFARDFQKFAGEAGRSACAPRRRRSAGARRRASSNDNGDVSWVVPAGMRQLSRPRCPASAITNGRPR